MGIKAFPLADTSQPCQCGAESQSPPQSGPSQHECGGDPTVGALKIFLTNTPKLLQQILRPQLEQFAYAGLPPRQFPNFSAANKRANQQDILYRLYLRRLAISIYG